MVSFTIRDIENLTGIKAHTLRIWEQRYGFFTPQRKESKHRFYDNEDLKKLMRISFLYHNGWKVSKIAALSPDGIVQAVQDAPVAEDNYAPLIARLVEAAIDFDEAAFLRIVGEISDAIGFENCVRYVCYPYLKKIGLLWSTNNIIPAQEHFSSYLIQNKIISETQQIVPRKDGPTIVLVCPQGEYHELPLLFINYLLKKSGWETIYLGANIGKKEIVQVGGLSNVDFVYLHLITNFTGMFVDDYLEDICRALPDKRIMASGEGVRGAQRSFVNLTVFRTDQQILDFIRAIPSFAHGF